MDHWIQPVRFEVTITATNNQLRAEQTYQDSTYIYTYTEYNGSISDFTPECLEQPGVAKTYRLPFLKNKAWAGH